MNQSPPEGDDSSNVNLPKPKVEGISLLDIPVLRPSSRTGTPSELQSMAPLSYDDGRVEYEFTCIASDSTPMFIGLWDTDDLSACQRISACNMDREEIVYNKETGVGFFNTVDGLRWCFKKQPIKRAYGPFNLLDATVGEEAPTRKAKQSADDILAGI